MSRREFSKPVKREALKRAKGQCEGVLDCGKRCETPLANNPFHFDHDIADGLGGEPVLENCVVLCVACHKFKTTKHDVPLIAKVKRIQDRENGIRKPSTLRGGGFRKSSPQNSASRPLRARGT